MFRKLSTNQTISIAVLVVAVGMFYWFAVRPSQLRKECGEWAVQSAIGGETGQTKKLIDSLYDICLKQKGL